jgi:branched-chain amino acid transport system permease protein
MLVPQAGLGLAGRSGTLLAAAVIIGCLGFAFFSLLQRTKRTDSGSLLAITFAGNLLVSSTMRACFGTTAVNVFPVVDGAARIGTVTVPICDLIIPAVGIVATAILWVWLQKTRSGRALRAVADNPISARLAGVDSDKVLARAVGLAAFLAALAGGLRAPTQTVAPDMWIAPLLASFAVVVLGGRNSIVGVVIGSCVIAGLETAVAWFWAESAAQYVALAAIVVGLVAYPTGIAGTSRHEVR